MYHISLIERCMDLDMMDEEFIQACCGRPEYMSFLAEAGTVSGVSCEAAASSIYKVKGFHRVL
jgi:hypothetical protein